MEDQRHVNRACRGNGSTKHCGCDKVPVPRIEFHTGIYDAKNYLSVAEPATLLRMNYRGRTWGLQVNTLVVDGNRSRLQAGDRQGHRSVHEQRDLDIIVSKGGDYSRKKNVTSPIGFEKMGIATMRTATINPWISPLAPDLPPETGEYLRPMALPVLAAVQDSYRTMRHTNPAKLQVRDRAIR